jgi:hypothetical protein
MIIKSLGRKARTQAYGRRGVRGLSAFRALAGYMNRGIEEEEGRAVLWHNFPGGAELSEEELVAEFEANARGLKDRKNGNVLYHEILSFSAGHSLSKDRLARHIADVGQEYLRERAPEQLAYGVIHLDTDHIHLHLMVSANKVRSPDRVRLTKADFAEVQKRTERYLLKLYPDLAQTRIYDKPRDRGREDEGNSPPNVPAPERNERVKTTTREQAMNAHRGAKSKKLDFAGKLHQAFEQARTFEELAAWCKTEGIRFYQRGKNPGIILTEADGTERRHRLATLGLLPHYEATNARLAEKGQNIGHAATSAKKRTPPNKREEDMTIPPKVVEAAKKTADTLEETTTRANAFVKEEVRFAGEVGKDFLFGTDRADRQPNHMKPPETLKEKRLRELQEAKARARDKDRTRESDKGDDFER